MSNLTSANEPLISEVRVAQDVFASVYLRIRALAESAPDRVAVADAAGETTFGELIRRSSVLGARLSAVGVEPGSCVGLFLDRSPEFVVAAAGVHAAGAAYLPIDTASPADRVEFVLADAGVSAVVTSAQQATRLPDGPWRTLILDGQDGAGPAEPVTSEPIASGPDDLAYVIYTSGSTGRPKGVELTHRNLANLVDWHVAAFGVGADDRASQVASLGFDAAVWEIWPHLAAGASVHFADEATRRSPQLLRDWLVAERITVGFVPTVLAEQLIHLCWPADTSLRTMLTGADVLHRRPAEDLPFRLVNNYGPTECTVVSTSGVVAPEESGEDPGTGTGSGAPSIGRPIAGATAMILDGSLRPVRRGEPGELCMAGALVGRGYRNDPELTAGRFVTVPADAEHPERGSVRVYRTGDQVRMLANGEIAFLGRLDKQIKIRGFRVEPAEIVASLDRFPGVAASAVVALGVHRNGATSNGAEPAEPELIGYVVPDRDAELGAVELRAAELRTFLATRLPEYMIPARFAAVDTLPLTINGKLDEAALPALTCDNVLPDEADPVTAGGDFGENSVEEQIAGMVRSLLKVPSVEHGQNIFLIGGHSMLAMQLTLQIRRAFGVRLSLRQVFDAPTVDTGCRPRSPG
jgi:amino acid adenylation domain-containing protein